MNRNRLFPILLAAAAIGAPAFAARRLPLEKIRLPPGFRISLYAEEVPDAREMALAPDGTVFVGTREVGNVYALPDRNHDNRADGVIVLARGLRAPSGVAFHDGALYVAEIGRVWKYEGILAHLDQPRKPSLVTDRLPREEWHGWKFIAFGPDGWLYLPVGAPCNVCEKPDPFAAILRLKPDGSAQEVFARGVRCSEGFDWDPQSRELWFTDNGRDNLGDDLPPDELNHAPKAGLHFGFPYCHGGSVPDPDLGRKRSCSDFTPPSQRLPAHVAPLGMRFYTGGMFPPDYRNRVFIAEHGSWNRSRKIGYRITTVAIRDGKAVSYQPFAEGWLQGEHAWGRPVDVLVMPDGALLVSDDQAGVIYRVTYAKN